MKDFTKFSIMAKLDEIENRLKIIDKLNDTIQDFPRTPGIVNSWTVNGIFDSMSDILGILDEEIKMDLFELKVFLHHMDALPVRNEKGELE